MMGESTGERLAVNWGELSYKVFYNRYPTDFVDENNLSVVTFLHCHNLHMVFPGDLERAGWEKLLENPSFVRQLKTVNVFVASHHGRESGRCDDVFELDGVRPQIVIFSDAGIQYDTQVTTTAWYRARVTGMDYHGKRRHVFTTRHDGKITIDAQPDRTTVATAR